MAEMETCRVAYTWTKDELLTSMRHHYQSKLSPTIVMAVNVMAVLMAAVSIFLLIGGGLNSSAIVSTTLFIVFAVYWLFLRRRVNEWWLSRGFDKSPAANALIQWEFSEQQVAQECGGLSSFKADWKAFSKVMEASDGFLLYTYPQNLFYWLPFSAFEAPDNILKFRTFVQGHDIEYVKVPD